MTKFSRAATITCVAVAALLISILGSINGWFHKPIQPGSTSTDVVNTSNHDTSSIVKPVIIDSGSRVPTASSVSADSQRLSNVPPGVPNKNPSGLIMPVEGIRANQLTDTYTTARAGGRVHDAIDIMAPHNSRVLAAADGTIKRFFQSKRGGTTIYQLSTDQHTVYYYAHLDHYAEGLKEGQTVHQGDLLGYVGDTGDAGPGNYHLHFAIWRIQDPKSFWDGENLNPYPILKQVK